MSDLKLNEREIEVLMEGLDSIKPARQTGEIMGDLMMLMLDKDPEERERMKKEMESSPDFIEKKRKEQELQEEVTILKGKLVLMKRDAREN